MLQKIFVCPVLRLMKEQFFPYLIDKFNNDQLQNITERIHLLNAAAEVIQSSLLVRMNQHHEGIPLAAHVLLPLQEVGDHLGRVRHQKVEVLVNGEHGHDSIATHIAVLVLETGPDAWHQRLQQLGFLELAQEAEG